MPAKQPRKKAPPAAIANAPWPEEAVAVVAGGAETKAERADRRRQEG